MNHHFDGETYDHDRDGDRLNRQTRIVYELMKDQAWRTLLAISTLTDEPEASVSARLRDLRKQRFGGHVVERRYVENGVWEYRVLPPEPKQEYQLELLEAAQ